MMAYDEDLANRIRESVQDESGVREKAMFGGLAFLLDGNMAVCASRDGGLMLRVAPEQTDTLLQQPHARPFRMRGRDIDGWLRIDADGLETEQAFRRWVDVGITYARSLPPK